MSTPDDTIAAISSPPGRSTRGLLRLSGPAVGEIIKHLTREPLPEPRQLVRRQLTLPRDDHSAANPSSRHPTIRLPALLLYFAAPASYTGQAMAEIQCPGHPALLARLLGHLLNLGGREARLAEPGEFTFRAYLAGKLDLTQAEGVAATIAVHTDAQLHAAKLLRQGRLGSLAKELVQEMATALAAVEAGIDFTDQDDVRVIDRDDLLARLAILQRQLEQTLEASRRWRPFDALPAVVLVGPPSAGKSTLFNALLGQDRSVISPQPGVTRDILAEPLWVADGNRRVQLMLMDIAGLDNPITALDHQVQDTARRAIEQADLILALGDDTRPGPALAASTRAPVLRIHSKADLPASRKIAPDELPVVAAQHIGLDALKQRIAEHLRQQTASLSGEMLALEPRHDRCFTLALEHVQAAMALLNQQTGPEGVDHPELVAGDMRLALDELAALGGQMTPDDVIGRIFATFCVGK